MLWLGVNVANVGAPAAEQLRVGEGDEEVRLELKQGVGSTAAEVTCILPIVVGPAAQTAGAETAADCEFGVQA